MHNIVSTGNTTTSELTTSVSKYTKIVHFNTQMRLLINIITFYVIEYIYSYSGDINKCDDYDHNMNETEDRFKDIEEIEGKMNDNVLKF